MLSIVVDICREGSVVIYEETQLPKVCHKKTGIDRIGSIMMRKSED